MFVRRPCGIWRCKFAMKPPLSEHLVPFKKYPEFIVIGKTFKTLFTGDKMVTDPADWMKVAINSYHKSLSEAHLRIGIKAYELLKGISIIFCIHFSGIAELQKENQNEKNKQIENKFIVLYQRNPQFVGRIRFLETLKERLFTNIPRQYNHRIAVYGVAGVGKIQTALEYVYSNEESFNRIYWISAMDQASLLSGYQNIVEEVGIVTPSSNLIAVSNAVLQWLRREESWLFVIDNLDITIVDGFLPENGPKNHTLITTRNPNSEGIPTEGLQVSLFDQSLRSHNSALDSIKDNQIIAFV